MNHLLFRFFPIYLLFELFLNQTQSKIKALALSHIDKHPAPYPLLQLTGPAVLSNLELAKHNLLQLASK